MERLLERLCPIANFNEDFAGWTVVDECIYCIGGRKEVIGTIRLIVGMNLNKYNTANPSSTWDLISPDRNLRLYRPSVFALGRNIYVVTGFPFVFDCYKSEENADRAYWGEYYNLDSQTWSYLPKQTCVERERLSAFHIAMDKRKIVFHSVCRDVLLFYDVKGERWSEEHHPDLLLANMVVRKGLEQSYCRCVLLAVAKITAAVVCHSTLYWLNNDLRRWFQSNSLRTELAWPLSVSRDDI